MDRLHALAARPRRTLGVLVVVLIATGVAVGSGANFTAQTANPSNTFTAGALTMSNSLSGAAVLTASNMKPGDSATGTVDIQNTGTVSGVFSLTRSALTDSSGTFPMSAKLDLVVKDCGNFGAGTPTCDVGDPVEYTGTLGAMSASNPLGTLAANEKHRYQFVITFNTSANNSYINGTSTATFQWDAVS